MLRLNYILFAAIFIAINPPVLWAADGEPDTEQVVEADVKEESSSTEAIMLRQQRVIEGYQAIDVADQKIDATFLEETLGDEYGAIVLFHDRGGEIDSAGVIAALRRDLPKHGWSSLTVALDYPFKPNIFLIENEPLVSIEPTEVADEEAQVNPSEAEASQSEAAVSDEDEKTEVDTSNQANAEQESATNVEQEKPQALPPISNQQRIGAALSFLELKDIKRIIFIGYGAGGDVALQLLETITRPISGLVLIGTPSFPDEPSFKQFEFPILDIYGEQDLAAVEKAVKQRKLLMKRAGNELYQIRKVSGANHQFLGLEPTLARIVNGWLRTEYIEQGDN